MAGICRQEVVLSSVRDLVNVNSPIGDASAALTRFLTATSMVPVSNLGSWERTIRKELWGPSYWRYALDRSVTKQPHGLWINLFSGDGFQREKALNGIAQGAPSAFLFAIMLRRLNDWVPQVRVAARKSINRIVPDTKNQIIVEALWGALPYLHTWGRWHASDKETLVDLVCVGDVPGLLASRIMQSPNGPAATVLVQATRRSAIDKYLIRIANDSIQPAVRARAYKIVLDEQASWLEGRKWVWTDKYWCKGKYEPVLGTRKVSVDADQLQVLRKASKDRSPVVRRIAAASVIAKLAELGKEALPLAKHLATDSYPSIAERGRFALDRIT